MEHTAKIIAVSGKGGVGKTTLAAAMIRHLTENKPDSRILAIDADPAVGLSTCLGVDVQLTLDEIRKEIIDNVEEGRTKEAMELVEESRFRIFEALVEKDGYAFLAIGRPEAEGCYCRINAYLKDVITMLSKEFDYVVIEASGICEPAPIAQTICSIPTMGPEYMKDGIPVVDSIVTVVDALRMKDEFGSGKDLLRPGLAEDDIENLVIQQIEFCNIILLNKASEVSPGELRRMREIIRAIQPKAEIVDCDYCEVDFDKILNTEMFDFDTVATSAAWIDAIEHHHDDEDDHDEHHHDEDGEAEEYGISTFVYYRREPLNIAKFDQFVARHWPAGIIRAKGICWFASEPETCYLFEQAGKQVSLRDSGQWYATMPDEELLDFMRRNPDLQRDWDDTYGDRMQKLVFIGQHLDREAITTALDDCLA